MCKNNFIFYYLLFISFYSFSQLVNNQDELNIAIQNATPGSTITLVNDTWKDVFIELNGKNGSSGSPITIEAQTPGSVLMTGNSRVYLKGSYLTVTGLVFQDPENLVASSSEIEPVIELKECNNCKVINNKIDTYNGTEAQKELKFKWVLNDGQYNEIAYNTFTGKYGVGSIINDNRNSSAADYLKIHHNYFADRTPINEVNEDNDQDAIRIGNSSTSLFDSYTEVYNNYFENFFGEVEVISNKSGNNKYYNNTFRNYAGSLTLRHGDNCEVYNNFFFAEGNTFSAGVRVIGEGHKVYNNYIEDTNSTKDDGSRSNATGGINISNGRVDSALNGYYQVIDATIVNNTFVNCDYAIRVGTNVGGDLTLAPENLTIANNIMLNSSDSALDQDTAPIGTSIYEGNITQNGDWDLTNNSNSNITVDENLLIAGENYYVIPMNSPAVDSGIGSYDFLTYDITNGFRDVNIDAGAQEYNSNGINQPYTSSDVESTIGFGAQIDVDPYLSTNVNSINVNNSQATHIISVFSNGNWQISEDISWVTLSVSNGNNTSQIEFDVDENTSGSERSGTITFTDTDGNNLTSDVFITQIAEDILLNEAEEIIADSLTAVGTQVGNDPANTIDNNTDTRWSAESTDGSAYLNYDLGCVHTLTNISIFFHKSTVRTTTVSIATSIDGVNFTDEYTQIASTLLTEEDYEIFNVDYLEARYIRISGYGNSEGSAWNSIEEVKFFGNTDSECADDKLSSSEFSLVDNNINIYPNPVSDIVNISSENTEISAITIYNTIGNKVLSQVSNNSYTEKVNVSHLSSGIYTIIINGTISSKLIIK